jgi:hypothetical protein
VADYQLPIGGTHRFTVNELWQGQTAPVQLPVTWSTIWTANLTLAPVGGNPSLQCDITAVTGVAGATGLPITATVQNGPTGTLLIDTVLQVDTVNIVPE